MASDDLVYGCILVLSIPFGLVLRGCTSCYTRNIVCFAAGLVANLLVCKQDALHSVILAVVNTAIIRYASRHRYLNVYSLVWCFSYLAFFRTCHWYGIPKPSSHSNAVQLLLTLRLISAACEVCDGEKHKRERVTADEHRAKELDLVIQFKTVDSSTWSLLSYSFSYIGSLTGPFYTCRAYQDMVNNHKLGQIPMIPFLKEKLRSLPYVGFGFLFLSTQISTKHARKDAFYTDTTFLYRLGYVLLLFVWFRMRMYSAWILAECMCITAGLGAYNVKGKSRPGAGPTNLPALKESESSSVIEYDFETIHNTAPYETEIAITFRETFRSWNMCVQWWLVTYIYKKLPGTPFIRTIMLMLVSGFWHGIHPGYYATFLSCPFFLLAEDNMNKGFRSRLHSVPNERIYDLIASFVRMRFFEYMSVGLLFLEYSEIWRCWASLYFCGHFLLMVLIVFGQSLIWLHHSNRRSHHSHKPE